MIAVVPLWFLHWSPCTAENCRTFAVARRKLWTCSKLPQGHRELGQPQWDRRGTAITAAAPPWLPWHRTITALAPLPPPCLRSTTAVQSREGRLASRTAIPWSFYCGYGGATTVLPPHWPRSAGANTAVMPPMIAVAPPSNRSCNSMRSPCSQWHRRGSAATRGKTHEWRVVENHEKLLAVSLRWWRFRPTTVVALPLRCDGGIKTKGTHSMDRSEWCHASNRGRDLWHALSQPTRLRKLPAWSCGENEPLDASMHLKTL